MTRAPITLVMMLVVGCYDAPKPACGFRCGPSAACPADYTCASDNRCHLNGSPGDLMCAPPDAAPPDAYSPAVIFTDPVAGAMVDPNTTIRVGFDVDVAGVSSSTFTVTIGNTTLPVMGVVSYDAPTHRATFSPASDLQQNLEFQVTLTGNIVDPATNRPLMPTSYMFRTKPDTTPPMIVATVPVDNATGVSVDTDVRFFFSEPVFNVASPNVMLLDGATQVPGLVSYVPANLEGSFDPQRQLLPNHTYTGRVTTSVNDGALNPLAATFDLTFTTGDDTIAPGVVDTSPLGGDTDVPVNANITVRFDEPVVGADATSFQLNGGAIAGTVTSAVGGTLLRFDPTVDLPAATTITVSLSSAITDAAGNSIGTYSFQFTTN